MAGRGPAASPNPRRRNKQPSEEVTGRAADAPALFKRSRYSTATQRWWDQWATSPQAEAFLPSDWERLQMLAPLVEAYWADPKPAILAEIRLNEERLGATVRDRQALRMKVRAEPEEAPSAPQGVADMDRYRKAFGG